MAKVEEREKVSRAAIKRFEDPSQRKMISEKRRSGEIPTWNKGKKGVQVGWMKGKTAETDPRVANIAIAARKRLTNHWVRESTTHKLMKFKLKDLLQSLGHIVTLEKFITVNGHVYAIDIYSELGGDPYLHEVGSCLSSKLLDLMSCYPRVYQIPIEK